LQNDNDAKLKLKQLKDLFDDGLITQEDYDSKKSQILTMIVGSDNNETIENVPMTTNGYVAPIEGFISYTSEYNCPKCGSRSLIIKKVAYSERCELYCSHCKWISPEKLLPSEIEAENANVPHCPRCGSTNVVPAAKGYGVATGIASGLMFGPLGLAAGFIGSNKMRYQCMKCGFR